MRRSRKVTNNFTFPDEIDMCDVPPEVIVKRLPQPAALGGTARAQSVYVFRCDLGIYNPA